MKTKTIFSIALIALPLTAMADPVVSVGPAAVPSNGTAVVATANPPYQTLTPSNDDKSHIASTAYVKGAYNDAIAAVNKVNSTKQDKFVTSAGDSLETVVLDNYAGDDIIRVVLHDGDGSDGSVFMDNGLSTMLLSAEGVIAAINTLYNLERVEIYTTWDTNNTKGVSLKSVYDFE